MTDKKLAEVLAAIRALTATERRQVVLAIQAQDGTPKTEGYQRRSEDWLFPGLEGEMKRQGLLAGSLSLELMRRWAPNYDTDSAAVRGTLKEKLKTHPNQAELLALGRVCAKALIEYVRTTKHSNAPLGPKIILAAVPDVAAALNASYPGYLANGKLGFLLRV